MSTETIQQTRKLTPEEIRASLMPAYRYIAEHFTEQGICLERIANTVHLTPSHFHRLFHKAFDATPQQAIDNRRIIFAKKLIDAGHPLSEIASLCGWAHQSHFNWRFKKLTGMTPKQYRNRQKTA